jgi:hypothetical protein
MENRRGAYPLLSMRCVYYDRDHSAAPPFLLNVKIMGVRRYEKYVITEDVRIDRFGPEILFSGEKHYQSDFSIWFFHISKPVLMEERPHFHDFDMYLFFLGRDDMGELGAEIEIGLGEEQEMYTITKPTSVYIPSGLVHCPLNFRIVEKPILFVHVAITPKYVKKEWGPSQP